MLKENYKLRKYLKIHGRQIISFITYELNLINHIKISSLQFSRSVVSDSLWPHLWPAGPALLLALCRPAGPGAPARMRKGRVRELHPRKLVGCMDFKPWWPPRQQRRGEGTLLHFHVRICGCPAAWAFSRGPCAIKVWYFGTEWLELVTSLNYVVV